jgi:hypothetical protein
MSIIHVHKNNDKNRSGHRNLILNCETYMNVHRISALTNIAGRRIHKGVELILMTFNKTAIAVAGSLI